NRVCLLCSRIGCTCGPIMSATNSLTELVPISITARRSGCMRFIVGGDNSVEQQGTVKTEAWAPGLADAPHWSISQTCGAKTDAPLHPSCPWALFGPYFGQGTKK